jgi:hypothetical protein
MSRSEPPVGLNHKNTEQPAVYLYIVFDFDNDRTRDEGAARSIAPTLSNQPFPFLFQHTWTSRQSSYRFASALTKLSRFGALLYIREDGRRHCITVSEVCR